MPTCEEVGPLTSVKRTQCHAVLMAFVGGRKSGAHLVALVGRSYRLPASNRQAAIRVRFCRGQDYLASS